MKQNKNFTALYVGVSLIWCVFLVSFAFSAQAIDRDGIFVFGALSVSLAIIFASSPGWSGETTIGGIFVSFLLMVYYSAMRFVASLYYDTLKTYEDCDKMAWNPAGAPENFPIINGTLILFTALGLLYITVAFLYWLKVIRKQPNTSAPYAWRFYFKSFFSWTRLLFLCIPLVLIVLIFYVHEVYGYQGVGSNGWGIIAIFLSYFVLYPFTPRKIRGTVAIAFLSFLTLIFLSVKNYEYMLFAMRSNLGITPESLGADEMLEAVSIFQAKSNWMLLSLPEFRGNLLLFTGFDQAPDPVTWKDFILIIPIGLYMLLSIILEPQLEPPVKHEKPVLENPAIV